MKQWQHLSVAAALLVAAGGCMIPRRTVEAMRPSAAVAAGVVATAKAGIRERDITAEYKRYVTYAAGRLAASEGTNSYSDKTGNCRLSVVDRLLRDPLLPVTYGEELTWRLHEEAKGETAGLLQLLATAATLLDAPATPPQPCNFTAANVVMQMVTLLETAHRCQQRALAPLSDAERRYLQENLYRVTTGTIHAAHSFSDKEVGRNCTDLLEKIDRTALVEAAFALAQLSDPELLATLRGADLSAFTPDTRLSRLFGGNVATLETAAGRVVLGRQGNHRYDLTVADNICMVIDLDASDDTYIEGVASLETPLRIIIDGGGSNEFIGESPGIQGGAVLGLSLLVTSHSVSNSFKAFDVAQGSVLGGVGLLVNDADASSFSGNARLQGQAIAGIGLLLNRRGDDSYHGAIYAQGVGSSLGFGALIDLSGDDSYYAGGKYGGGYPDSPGFGAWSQGVGVGPRGVANGGIGVLLDGSGDDTYEYDYFSHGGGYWFALGLARDFSGNDKRLGATRTLWDGSEREVKPYVRWGLGFGCHYAVGVLIDDAGDDLYKATFADTAFCWDIGTGVLLDLGGNDTFSGSSAGRCSNAGVAIFLSADGDDTFDGGSFGYATPKVGYHPMPDAGGNFAWFIKSGGNSRFTRKKITLGDGHGNGWTGGFYLNDTPVTLVEEQGGR